MHLFVRLLPVRSVAVGVSLAKSPVKYALKPRGKGAKGTVNVHFHKKVLEVACMPGSAAWPGWCLARRAHQQRADAAQVPLHCLPFPPVQGPRRSARGNDKKDKTMGVRLTQ